MKLKQKIRTLMIATFTAVVVVLPLMSSMAYADTSCGVQTSIIHCSAPAKNASGIQASGIWLILIMAINILTAGVGVAALAGIVWGAVLYTTAGGNPGQVKKAISTLTNVGIGIVAYALMWAFLNFLIPGGLFT